MKETNILIVGFGFSAIPLLRELDISGIDYTIISEKDGSVWAGLDRSGNIDFDLVSSYYTSYYTFDIVDDIGEDRYPTAREFYDMHRRYYRKYADKITVDFVTHIENHDDYSLVHTRNGDCYKANSVIISTAFKRKVHDSLNNFDFTIRNKTVVLNTLGDSGNLIISRLVPGDNKIICLQNGFLALDKLFQMGKVKFSLDQLEAHQISRHFRSLYTSVIDFNFMPLIKINPKHKLIAAYMKVMRGVQYILGRLFTPHNFYVPYAWTRRTYDADHPIKSPIPNGAIVIKYWPIDQYERDLSANLPERIKEGYLLNDIMYFVSEGLVKLWSKERSKVDHENKTIECDGEKISYDHFIDGDTETPRLPKITYPSNGRTVEYEYCYKNNYLGVIPKDLNRIYLVGYTRPLTGGLANITEMQGLLVHKMLTDEPFRSSLRNNIDEKLEKYNKWYYPSDAPGSHDHLVFYGFYTEDVAKEIGIALSPRSCKSLRDLAKYFTYPNNADKYRQTGPYKIDRCAEFIDHVYRQHKGYKLIWQLALSYVSYHVLFAAVFAALYFHGWINGYVLGGALTFQYLFGYWAMIPVSNSAPFFGTKLGLFLLYLPLLLDPRTALLIFPLDFAITFALRQLPTARYPFNDLKNKKKYRSFFQHYKEVFNQVRGRRNVPLPATKKVSQIAG